MADTPKIPDWLQQLGTSTFEHHRKNPKVTLAEHMAAKSAEMAVRIAEKKLIYLDTKFWIILRDAALDRTKSSVVVDLLAALRTVVRDGKALCPFAMDILVEVLNQKDPTTRLATAQLIDELSQGTALRPEHERLDFEFDDVFTRLLRREIPRVPLKDRVWVAPGYVLGEQHPMIQSFDAETMLATQKAFADDFWSFTFEQMAGQLGTLPDAIPSRNSDFANRMNANHAKYANQLTSLEQACATELYGFLDLYRDAFRKMLTQFAREKRVPGSENPSTEELDAWIERFIQLFVQAFREGKLSAYFPTGIIKASLFGGLRWDKKRKYRPNDFHDFGHAAAALPYHSIFATEQSLAHLVRQMALDRTYGAQIVTHPDELTATILNF